MFKNFKSKCKKSLSRVRNINFARKNKLKKIKKSKSNQIKEDNQVEE